MKNKLTFTHRSPRNFSGKGREKVWTNQNSPICCENVPQISNLFIPSIDVYGIVLYVCGSKTKTKILTTSKLKKQRSNLEVITVINLVII